MPAQTTASTYHRNRASVSATPASWLAEIPYSPSEPPVTLGQLSASCSTISPTARVSIKKNTPCARTTTLPATAATTAPAAIAAISVTGALRVTCSATQPAAYAPAPKYAPWPSDGSPVIPTSRSRLAAISANTRIRDSIVTAYASATSGAAAIRPTTATSA